MARHPFAKIAVRGLQQAFQHAVFALNIPMSSKDRERVKELLQECANILNQY